jgi:hypothetical protein
MPADCILHPSLAEFSISADDDGLMFCGPHGQFVILGARQAGGTRCPALIAAMPQHASHRGIHVVIKEKSH